MFDLAVISLPIEHGHKPYLDWIGDSTKDASQ